MSLSREDFLKRWWKLFNNYELKGLTTKQFEKMIQELLGEMVGLNTFRFIEGSERECEATFRGKVPYPSQSEPWDGEWIFQIKLYDIDQPDLDDVNNRL